MISLVRNSISFVRYIISFVQNNISFVRNIISLARNIISFVRNIIWFVRNNISFVRNNISFVRNIIWFVRNIISFVHSLTGRGPGSDIHWQSGDLGLTLTDRAGTWFWHSLTGWGSGGDTHWQSGDLGLTLTDGAGTQSPPCQWVSDPGPRHVITQVPALSASIRPRSPSCQWVSDPGPRHVSECQTQVPALLEVGPDGSFVSTGACNLEVPGSNHGIYSAAYGTVHYKEPLKSFEIRVGHSPGFGLPSVAILPWLCRKRRKAIFTHSALLVSVRSRSTHPVSEWQT